MIGVRFRDLEGHDHELGVNADRFVEVTSEIAEWIDVRNGFSASGLVDAHCHLTGANVETMAAGIADVDAAVRLHTRQHLDAGVLLVADKGTRIDAPLSLAGIPVDERPSVVRAGAIVTVEHGYFTDFGLEIDPSADPERWIDEVCDDTISWLKLVGDWPRKGRGPVSNFTKEQLARIVDVAHGHGLRVAIHTAARATSSHAVAAGVDSIEHGLFLTEADLESLGARGGAWVPTITAMEGLRDALGADSSGGRLMATGLENVRQLLASAPGFGVRVLAGTDLHLPHGDVATEVLKLIEYGLTPEHGVKAVTTDGYDYLDVTRTFAPGEVADLVSFAGDPREDPALLLSPTFIVRSGRVVHRT